MRKTANNILENFPGLGAFPKCLGIKSGETVLILTDAITQKEAIIYLEKACREFTPFVEVDWRLPLKVLEDIPLEFHSRIKESDVIILAASQSWYHAKTRREAKYGLDKRIIECYDLSLDMLRGGALCANYELIAELGQKIIRLFEGKSQIRIISDAGTGLTGRIKTLKNETGIYNAPGSGGNLPAGEVSLGVEEGSIDGRVIFDLSFDIIGNLQDSPLEMVIEKGFVKDIQGKKAKQLYRIFRKEERLRNVVEIGIGTNPWSVLGRKVLEDEKKWGTAHIGFGNNTYFDGKIRGPHYDGVFSNPTIVVNGTEIMIKKKDSFFELMLS